MICITKYSKYVLNISFKYCTLDDSYNFKRKIKHASIHMGFKIQIRDGTDVFRFPTALPHTDLKNKKDKWAGVQFRITASHFPTHIFQLYSYK